jgi:hypothetical protein
MADPQDEMESLFKLMAVQLLMIDTLASRYLATPDPVATATAHREHMRKVLSGISLPFLGNPGASELFVGGIGDEIDRMIENAGQTVARRVDEQRHS